MVFVTRQKSLVTIAKVLGLPMKVPAGFAATPRQTVFLSTITPRKGRQNLNQTGRIQWLSDEGRKRFDRLKAAGLPLNQIKQYLASFKQRERDAANWSEEETNRASKLKAEGMSDDRIHKMLRLQSEDALRAKTLGEQSGESRAESALKKWAEEDQKLAVEKSRWNLVDWRRARHLKGAGLSPPAIGICVMNMADTAATPPPAPWKSHHGQTIDPVIYYDGGGVGGVTPASSTSSADGGGVDIGSGGGGWGGDGFGIDIDIGL